MPIYAWIVVGIIGGFIGSKMVNKRGEWLVGDLFLGVVGAFFGGWLFNQLAHPGAAGINLYSILVSAVGAIVVLVAYHELSGRRIRI